MLQGNNREQWRHFQTTSRSFNLCCARIRRSAILNWRIVGDRQNHIFSRSSLPIVYFSHRCFFHLYDFVKSKMSEITEFAEFPILWLNAGAQISRGGQVQRPCEIFFAPPIDYMTNVTAFTMKSSDFTSTQRLCNGNSSLINLYFKSGCYPKGGGEVRLNVKQL